jgi:hypothetical protein
MTVREVAVLASGVGHVIEHKRCGIIAVSAGGQRRKPRHVVCSLPNNLDVAHDRVLSLQVFLKRPNVFERLKVGGRARNNQNGEAIPFSVSNGAFSGSKTSAGGNVAGGYSSTSGSIVQRDLFVKCN